MRKRLRASNAWPRTVSAGHASVKVYRTDRETTSTGYAYTVAWTTPAGRKRQRFADAEEALNEARLKAAQLNAGRIEAAAMTSTDREELAAARRAVGDVPLLSALEEWRMCRDLAGGQLHAAAEMWAARNGSRLQEVTATEAVRRFLAAKRAAKVDVAASYLKTLPVFAERFGERPMGTIIARELDAWMVERYPHPVSRNTTRKRLISLWRWCRDAHYLPRDQKTEAEFSTQAQEAHLEIGIIDHTTFGRLLHYFRERHPEYLAALALAGFAGLRRSEIHAQIWEDIDLASLHVRVTKAKRNTPAKRLVELSEAARNWLLLCPNRAGRVCKNFAIDRLRDIVRTAKDDAGNALFLPLPENCFRHAFISHRVALSGDIPRTSLEAGNSVKIVNQHYRALVKRRDGEAWFAIPTSEPDNANVIDLATTIA